MEICNPKKKNCCHDSGFLSYVVYHPDVYCEKETDPLSFIKFSIVFGYIWREKKKKKNKLEQANKHILFLISYYSSFDK